MSDEIREECGLAMVRLRRPLSYYREKYGTALWGFNKLFLLMEKQHNRGQDGAGVGSLKLNMPAGQPYLFRQRQLKNNPLDRIFNKLLGHFHELERRGYVDPDDPESIKRNFEFGAELFLGHLRYGTSGGYTISSCHPHFRKSNWPTKNLMLAGNFNMTNTPALNQGLIERGQHPIYETDTQTLLEEIGFHLDEEHDNLYHAIRNGGLPGPEIAARISDELDLSSVLKRASRNWDGGFSLVGIIGNGDCFAFRDSMGIRPLHWMMDDEVIAVTSERPPLMTVFNKETEDIREVQPGKAVIVKKTGEVTETEILPPLPPKHCSFERIYFSRGNDPDIYRERKALGAALVDQILDSVNGDLERTVFSFIPNTSEIAYYGMTNRLKDMQMNDVKERVRLALQKGTLSEDGLDALFASQELRTEKIAIKDIKLRTFISQEEGRHRLASHIYDISYGCVGKGDNLVCVDDSVVRGTTLKTSIIKILARLDPKRIIIASTAPQIRYPDCYGIDMSELGKFIAFQAAVSLIKKSGRESLLEDIYRNCLEELKKPPEEIRNCVQAVYQPFTQDELSAEIARLITPKLDFWQGEVRVLFQTVENLHASLTQPCGDWYFTGNYPTSGGYRVVNRAYVNFFEKKQERSY